MLRFEAPANGLYTFSVISRDALPILYVRSDCENPIELGCDNGINDEGGRDDNVAHAQFMNAGQVIYLFLDGVNGDVPANFDINIQQF